MNHANHKVNSKSATMPIADYGQLIDAMNENVQLKKVINWLIACLEKPGPYMDKYAAIEKARDLLGVNAT